MDFCVYAAQSMEFCYGSLSRLIQGGLYLSNKKKKTLLGIHCKYKFIYFLLSFLKDEWACINSFIVFYSFMFIHILKTIC